MAAKNRQRKKSKASDEVKLELEENNQEAENSGGEEDEAAAVDEAVDDEEFSLDEVLRLGGTRVSLAGNTVEGSGAAPVDHHLQQLHLCVLRMFSGESRLISAPHRSSAG